MSKNKKRLPGSEKLTRPEEISALSKYLGNIKKVQEEHTTLNPDNLEVPGRTTGKIPNIEILPGNIQHLDVEGKVALEEGRVGLDGNLKDTESLSEFREDLENIKTIDTLDETKLGLENTNSETNLEETKVGLEISNNIDTLGETRLDLEDDREAKLEDTKLAIEDSRENSLEETKLTLEDNRETNLIDTILNLDDNRETNLSDTKLTLEDSRDTSLEDTILNLEDNRDTILENTILNLEDSRETNLIDTILNLEDSRDTSLEDTKLTLEDGRETNLIDTILNLEDNRDTNLEDTKLTLEDDRETSLGDTKLTLEDDRETSLGDTKLTLKDNRDTSLEDTKIDLEDNRDTILEETKLTLEDSRNTNLEDTKIDLEDSRETNLIDTILNLEDSRETELENERLSLEDTRETNLENTKLGLEVNNEVSLDETKLNLEDLRETDSLGDTKLTLEVNEDTSLGNTIIDLEDSRDTNLEDTKLNLEVETRAELENTRVDLSEVLQDTNLSDTRLNLEDKRDISLGDERLDLDSDNKTEELENTKLTLEDSRKINLEETMVTLEDITSIDSLEDTRLQLEIDEQSNLEDTKLTLEDDRDTSLGETRLDLEDNRELNLIDTKLNLEDSRETNLSDTKLTLEASEDTSLEDTRLSLEDSRKTKLSDARLDLEVNEDTSLEETRLNLKDNRETSLENTKLTLKVSEDTSLEVTKLNLEDNRETNLSDTRLDLEVSEDTSLEDTKLTLEDDRDTSLEDTKLTLGDDRETSLGETKLTLEDDRDISLGDTKLTIEDSRDTSLEDTKLTLEDDRKTNLEDTKLTLEDDRETELESFLDSIITDEGDVALSDTIIKGIDEVVEIDSLYDSILEVPETNTSDAREDGETSGWEEKLEEEIIQRPDSDISPGWDEETLPDESSRIGTPSSDTSDTREDGQPTGWSEGLYNTSLNIPEAITSDTREDGSSTGWNEELYKSFIGVSEDQKYIKILEMAATLGPWGSKVSSLVSAVLGNKKIDSSLAAWFDGELKKILQEMDIMDSFNHILKDRTDGENNQKALDLRNASPDTKITEFGDRIERPGDPRTPRRMPGRDGIKPKESLPDYKMEMPKANKEGQSDYIYNSEGYIYNSEGGEDRTGDTLFEHIIVDTFSPSKSGSGDRGYKTIPKYQFPSGGIDALNINNFIRLGAERLFDLWDPRTVTERRLKTILLDETIALLVLAREQLEKLTKSNRDRLPGDDMGLISDLMTGDVSGALDTVKDAALGVLGDIFGGAKGVDTTNPLNRPKTKLTGKGYLREQTTGFDRGNARTTASDVYNANKKDKWKNLANNLVNSLIGGLADKWGAERDISFSDKYIKNSFGTVRTISELCNLTNPEKVESVEALFELLKTSPYITTPYKFGTLDSGRYGAMTLDTNAYWEVIIEPFCHTQMNGGYSFLPSVQEINIINQITHGVTTGYSKWLPVTSFELQKSKLDTKTIGLYSGEFSIPTVAELSNELRITMIDDSYKSWRNYFQKCMDVSVYSSESHTADYYYKDMYTAMQDWKQANTTEDINDDFNAILNVMKNKGGIEYPTIVDKSRPIAALYKNVTFQIQIYIMTPQYSTIRRFNLLCVLNGFEESAAGDIDAGGYDLNLSFSIVGENPKPDAKVENLKPKKEALNPKIGEYSPSNSKSDSLIKLL